MKLEKFRQTTKFKNYLKNDFTKIDDKGLSLFFKQN